MSSPAGARRRAVSRATTRSPTSSNPVDAHLALLVDRDDVVLTSDDADIRARLRRRRVRAQIVHV
jgi:hypothetical protein